MGTGRTGRGELWLDPEGNNSDVYDCKIFIESDAIKYTWSYENKNQKGSFTFNEGGAIWLDSWHQPKPVQCSDVLDAWGIFTVVNAYKVPDNPDWGWQSKLSERPDDSLVLQMTNITPWGEDGRAVRMVFPQEKG